MVPSGAFSIFWVVCLGANFLEIYLVIQVANKRSIMEINATNKV